MSTFQYLAGLVEEHYVLADLAPAYAATIRQHADELHALLPDREAANARLHELVPDKHLIIRATPSPAPRAPTPECHAGGVALIERRPDNIAVLALGPTFGSPEEMRPHLYAAAGMVGDAAALIIDLRECGGGDADTAALIHGWLLGPESVVLGRFERRGASSVDYVSDPSLGQWYAGPVAMLTSARTFSGGEDLAYVQQALGRAVVVGERTAGGAHPVEHFPLPHGGVAQVPVARSVIASTGANWEGVGVIPDVLCAAAEAVEGAVEVLEEPTAWEA